MLEKALLLFCAAASMMISSTPNAAAIGIMRLTCMYRLAVNVGACCYFKYLDKAARGRKV